MSKKMGDKGESEKKKGEMRLNINYLVFLEKIVKEKLENLNKEKLKEIYGEIVNLESNNINRVNKRFFRGELGEIRGEEINKRELKENELKRVSKIVCEKLGERESNYLSIKV